MGRGSGACKFLGMIFILSLLIQGSYAAEESNETNTNLNYTINDTLNGTIIGTINGTINDPINGTVIGTINGTVNGTVSGTISSTISKIDPFQWVLILPILIGYLLFLCWLCRFFDKMNFCLVLFVLIALILGIFLFIPISRELLYALTSLIIFPIVGFILYEEFIIKGNVDQGNPIMNLHDIVRNFIVIFAVLIWPLVLFYLHKHNIESVTFYGIEKLEFPIYIIAASTIGALSYILLSIEETFGQLIPEYKKISIAWSYVRRILIAPFIALIAVYILPFSTPTEADPTNKTFIFAFSFFAGFYTKTIEKWVYLWVQKLLPEHDKEELESRTEKYNVEKSEFVKKLGLDEDLAYMLYGAKIRTIEDLASCSAEEIRKKINLDTRNLGEGIGCPVKEQRERLGSYSEQQIQIYINKAQEYLGIDKSNFVTELEMGKDLAFKLYYIANIKTIKDLATCNPKEVHEKICDCKKEAEELAKRKKIDTKDAYKELCGYSEDEIKEYIDKAEKRIKKEVVQGSGYFMS
ncbi:hypothetical protein FTO70_13545 [Methanosarcina sp. KYL-1]|uniref:hypothetical protein n=1 Tax=Methanosarcina sp. KYL-1 TaxID=2602068 RepID=UPI002101D38C|nr:hypothetical protein [Methanosarcina sp. KYL-1]MCQ1536673.1 hypothetical protein [Methanosarcina sp. KYL-1]